MEKDYISIMQKKENLCRAYLRKADYEYAEKGRHTKDEGRYLQEASKLQFEMAQLSDGEARQHHLRRQKEIDAKIVEIAREVSPDVYQRILQENESKKRGDSRTSASSSGKKQEKSGKKSVKGPSEETVESWFKPMPSHSFAEVSGMNDLKEQLRGCIEDARLNAISSQSDVTGSTSALERLESLVDQIIENMDPTDTLFIASVPDIDAEVRYDCLGAYG